MTYMRGLALCLKDLLTFVQYLYLENSQNSKVRFRQALVIVAKGFLKLSNLLMLMKQNKRVCHFPEKWPSSLLVNYCLRS